MSHGWLLSFLLYSCYLPQYRAVFCARICHNKVQRRGSVWSRVPEKHLWEILLYSSSEIETFCLQPRKQQIVPDVLERAQLFQVCTRLHAGISTCKHTVSITHADRCVTTNRNNSGAFTKKKKQPRGFKPKKEVGLFLLYRAQLA